MTNQPAQPSAASERLRLSIELSRPVALLLDHIVEVTGGTRSQIAAQVLCDALPGLVERSDAIKRRASELERGKLGGGKK